MFGNEYTEFGRAVKDAVSTNYKYSLDSNIAIIMDTMTEEVVVAVPMRRGDVSRSTIAVEPFRRHAQLPHKGTYLFEIEPSQVIFGVTGIGIEIKNEEQD